MDIPSEKTLRRAGPLDTWLKGGVVQREPASRGAASPGVRQRLRAAWDDPDRLYQQITAALDAGVAAEVVPAARRLVEIDTIPARGANTLSLVLRTCADHAGAEQVLIDHLNRGHDDPYTWLNLAPLAAWRGAFDDVDEALDNALRGDPDYAGALEWGFRHHQRHGGTDAARAWLAERGSRGWRARVMLGREELRAGDVEAALEYFDAACGAAPHRPEPLTAISDFLARADRPRELVEFVLRRWRGSNGPYPLLYAAEANLRLGQPGEAALNVSRLRGVAVPPECRGWAADLERRVQEACTRAGI